MKLFRDEAVEAKRRRLWGEVRLAQPPALTIWTCVIALICLAIFSALILGRYTRKETVQGFLAPEAGIVQVRAVQAGRIARVLVSEGDFVSKGAPLIEFTSDVASSGQAPVLDRQIAETQRQYESIVDQREAVGQSYAAERRRLNEQIASQQRLKDILIGQRRVQADALALSEADAARLAQLQAQGFAPAAEVDRRRRAVLAEQSTLADLDTRISQIDATVAELRSQAAAVPARQAEALASLARDGANIIQRQAELEVARGHVLRAPVAGTVSGVQARAGMTPDNLPLLSIAPSGSALEARLLVPTRAAGFLSVGQEARIQVQAFPFQRFGFVEGQVRTIASTVISPGEAAFPIEHSEPVYEVRVTLARDFVDAYGQRRRLQPGMALTADIPIDRRRLWQQLFDPLLAAGKRSTS